MHVLIMTILIVELNVMKTKSIIILRITCDNRESIEQILKLSYITKLFDVILNINN